MRKTLVMCLVGLTVLVVALDPSMGTTVDLDASNAVAGQIAGENYAKPIPPRPLTADTLAAMVRGTRAGAAYAVFAATHSWVVTEPDRPSPPLLHRRPGLTRRGPPSSS